MAANDLKQITNDPGGLVLAHAPEGFDALVMADIARARGGLTVFVARDASRASAFIDAMAFFAPGVELLRFPAWDCLPYDRMGPSAGVAAERMATLTRLARGIEGKKPVILVTQVPALLQRVPPRSAVTTAAWSAKAGDEVEIDVAGSKLLNKRTGESHTLKPLGDVAPIIEAGGVFEYAKQSGML